MNLRLVHIQKSSRSGTSTNRLQHGFHCCAISSASKLVTYLPLSALLYTYQLTVTVASQPTFSPACVELRLLIVTISAEPQFPLAVSPHPEVSVWCWNRL